jgi:hypothetical protein
MERAGGVRITAIVFDYVQDQVLLLVIFKGDLTVGGIHDAGPEDAFRQALEALNAGMNDPDPELLLSLAIINEDLVRIPDGRRVVGH